MKIEAGRGVTRDHSDCRIRLRLNLQRCERRNSSGVQSRVHVKRELGVGEVIDEPLLLGAVRRDGIPVIFLTQRDDYFIRQWHSETRNLDPWSRLYRWTARQRQGADTGS